MKFSFLLSFQADKIVALLSAADVEVEAIWATLLAKALEGKNVKDLLSNVGTGGGAPAAGSALPAASSGGAAAEEEKKEELPEEKEESDDDMVRTLFNFQCIQSFVNILLHYLGFWTLRLIYFFTSYLGEFVTSLVRCEAMREHVLAPCQIF